MPIDCGLTTWYKRGELFIFLMAENMCFRPVAVNVANQPRGFFASAELALLYFFKIFFTVIHA